MNTITLCFFGSLAEELNTQTTSCTIQDTLSVNNLKKKLVSDNQDWQALNNESILCAINHEMATGDQMIQINDEVAFFPPVTGG